MPTTILALQVSVHASAECFSEYAYCLLVLLLVLNHGLVGLEVLVDLAGLNEVQEQKLQHFVPAQLGQLGMRVLVQAVVEQSVEFNVFPILHASLYEVKVYDNADVVVDIFKREASVRL